MRTRRRITDTARGATTLLAEDCTIGGTIRSDGDLMVCGNAKCDAHVAGTVTIIETGTWEGQLTARNLIIAGTVIGDVVANGQIEICESARITGTVTGAAIAVGQGAIIDGEIRTLKPDAASEFVDARDLSDEPAETGTG